MKILLVDDHAMMRDGLRAVLTGHDDLQVVGEATDGAEAVAKVASLHPDIVVMDISMPGLSGIEATRQVLAESPTTRVIGLSMHNDRRYVRAMFQAGAVGYLLKSAASEELIHAIRAVAERRVYVSPGVAEQVVDGFVGREPGATPSPMSLSGREREVLQLIADGKTSKEIAAAMTVAVSTVETYRKQIMDKLGLRTVAELTKYAVRHGLTSIE